MTNSDREFVYRVVNHVLDRADNRSHRRSEGRYILDFADLIEIRNIRAFRQEGVSMRVLVRTAAHCRDRFDTAYPFSDQRFLSDGAAIFAETAAGLEDVSANSQLTFEDVVRPSLFEPIDWDGNEPVRWYPSKEWQVEIDPKSVCLDPKYAFGAPIVSQYRVATRTLVDAYHAEGKDPRAVTSRYKVSEQAVNDALAFERARERRKSLVIA